MTETATGTQRERTETTDITESERHRLLADKQRRVALEVLSDQETPLTLAELAVDVSARENDNSTEAASRTEIEIALHHVHLPLIAEKDIIHYDPETKRIEPHEQEFDFLTA